MKRRPGAGSTGPIVARWRVSDIRSVRVLELRSGAELFISQLRGRATLDQFEFRNRDGDRLRVHAHESALNLEHVRPGCPVLVCDNASQDSDRRICGSHDRRIASRYSHNPRAVGERWQELCLILGVCVLRDDSQCKHQHDGFQCATLHGYALREVCERCRVHLDNWRKRSTCGTFLQHEKEYSP